jgi:uncharacterized protein (DUF2062 family)
VKLKYRLRKWYRQLISLKGEPRLIAAGFAIGIFVGVTPTIPFHTVLIIILCFIFKKNVTAGYLGSWLISNPLTIPFLYVTQYRLGGFLLDKPPCQAITLEHSLPDLIQRGGDLLLPLLTGGLIMAPFIALPAYFISYQTIKNARRHHHGHDGTKHS